VLIALTGWGQEEDRLQSRNAGFDAHMVKPVDYEVLLTFLAAPPSTGPTNADVSGAPGSHDDAETPAESA